MKYENNITIALVDDHNLLRKGLAELINGFDDFEVILEASDGNQMIKMLNKNIIPEIVILDINMKPMDGFTTANWLKLHHPDVRILALSMYDDEISIIKMFRSGAHGYILKDADPTELKHALIELKDKGFYYSNVVGGIFLKKMHDKNGESKILEDVLSKREIEFLKWCCSELTYKEIADRMHLSPRTIDGYREALFQKLGVKNRVGLVLIAIRYRICII